MTRPHTGRRRNDGARRAILDAAAALLSMSDPAAVTIEAVAERAGVGRQTIYRWWPSKGAVLLEAMTERAAQDVPIPDTGEPGTDLSAFLVATFAAADAAAATLRAVMAEAQRDPHAARLLAGFTGSRRAALRGLLGRAGVEGADAELVADQAFGVLWYRLLTGHGSLDEAGGRRLAAALTRQLETGRAPDGAGAASPPGTR